MKFSTCTIKVDKCRQSPVTDKNRVYTITQTQMKRHNFDSVQSTTLNHMFEKIFFEFERSIAILSTKTSNRLR